MIKQVIPTLEQHLHDITAEEIAEILWLTWQQWQSPTPNTTDIAPEKSILSTEQTEKPPAQEAPSPSQQQSPPSQSQPQSSHTAGITTRLPEKNTDDFSSAELTAPLAVPDSKALRRSLELLKAIRPLIRLVPSTEERYLDVPATVRLIAETDMWLLKLQPVLEPWLELALVVDDTPSMVIWQRIISNLRRVLAQSGIFRDVKLWSLGKETIHTIGESLPEQEASNLCLRPGFGPATVNQPPCRPQELLDPSGRRLILLVTDCIDPYWDTQAIRDLLRVWVNTSPMSLVQVLPEWLWGRTSLSNVTKGKLTGLRPGQPSQSLGFVRRERWHRQAPQGVQVPVTTLEPAVVDRWSKLVAGYSSVTAPGLIFSDITVQQLPSKERPGSPSSRAANDFKEKRLTPQERWTQFQNFSSLLARRLAGCLAACPEINLPVIRMVQAALLPESQQVHVAEVLFGGLFEPQTKITAHMPADQVQYDFHQGVRALVKDTIPPDDAFDTLSLWLNHRFGYSLEDFQAYVTNERVGQVKPFAGVLLDVLQRRGRAYSSVVSRIEQVFQPQYETFAELVDDQGTHPDYEIRARGTTRTGRGYIEPHLNLSDALPLHMVLIPDGTFTMGSPENEKGRQEREGPQHRVIVPSFFMSRYPVTQAQWRAVAALDTEEYMLKADPSCFKGDDLPIESISWYEAVEFCQRLTTLTNRPYRLPSEAEWEYACRAETTTPFYFGSAISTQVANYKGDVQKDVLATANSVNKISKATVAVDHFHIANRFGLSNMHGNVWEWCQDHWQQSYDQKMTNIAIEETTPQASHRVVRGGSWFSPPEECRSASRFHFRPNSRQRNVGFRIICERL